MCAATWDTGVRAHERLGTGPPFRGSVIPGVRVRVRVRVNPSGPPEWWTSGMLGDPPSLPPETDRERDRERERERERERDL